MVSTGKMLAFIKAFGGTSAPSEVVILPETEMTLASVSGDIGIYHLYMPPENVPAAGAKCKLIWGGMEYTNTVVDVSAMMGAPMLLLGNSGLFEAEGMDLENPDADAPYCVALVPDGMPLGEGDRVAYGMIMSMGIAPDPPVLSIVQVGAASGGESAGSGALVINITSPDGSTLTADKTYNEAIAAIKASKNVIAIISRPGDIYEVAHASMAYGGMVLFARIAIGDPVIYSLESDGTFGEFNG